MAGPGLGGRYPSHIITTGAAEVSNTGLEAGKEGERAEAGQCELRDLHEAGHSPARGRHRGQAAAAQQED